MSRTTASTDEVLYDLWQQFCQRWTEGRVRDLHAEEDTVERVIADFELARLNDLHDLLFSERKSRSEDLYNV